MASYPTPSDYQEAVQFPETAFADETLQDAEPRENMLGLPQPITGAYAAVFPMKTAAGTRWAAKCFLTEVADQQTRYAAIADHLATCALDATVEFDYQPSGIQVEGDTYPLLKMEWVDGTPLNRYVADHLDAPERLDALAAAWADLMGRLEDAEIAHGDLQHGNILVHDGPAGEGPQLRLVDYDTMYVPALDGRTSAEVGHRNYQHPDRTERDFGPYLDRFAGLVVYTALRACALQPGLWAQFDTGENLLFRADDFYEPEASPLFAALRGEEALQPLADTLQTACLLEPERVPPLAAVRDGTADVQAALRARPTRRDRDGAARTGLERWFAPAVGAGLVGAIAAGLLAGTGVGLAVGGGVVVMAVTLAAYRHRRLPVMRRRRRLQQEIAHFGTVIDRMRRQTEALRRKRAEVVESVDARRAERLQEVQDEALYDKLKYHFVGEARQVDGVTHKAVVRLKAAGIRTAYAATPERLQEVRRLSDETRARLNMWRAALVAEYEDAIPDTLSPAEARRIDRFVERCLEDLDTEIARTKAKRIAREEERRQIQRRLDDLPALSVGQYLAALLRLRPLPDAVTATPTPRCAASQGPPQGATSGTTNGASASNSSAGGKNGAPDAAPVPQPDPDDEAPWWRRAGAPSAPNSPSAPD
jgi:hypothetical protein